VSRWLLGRAAQVHHYTNDYRTSLMTLAGAAARRLESNLMLFVLFPCELLLF
jgi:hypothetical protein